MSNYGPRTFLAFATFVVAAGAVAFSIWHSPPIQYVSSIPDENSEEYAVYSALISELFIKENVELLVIQDQTLFYANADYLKATTSEERIKDLRKYCPSVDEDAIRDFEAKHMRSSKLSTNFALPLKYVLVNKADFDESRTQDAREIVGRFYELYPEAEGMIGLSKVGFNKDHSQAFLRIEFTFCPL